MFLVVGCQGIIIVGVTASHLDNNNTLTTLNLLMLYSFGPAAMISALA